MNTVYGSLYYLPESSHVNLNEIPPLSEPLDKNLFIHENANFTHFLAHNAPYIGETINSGPKSKLDDGFIDIVKMKRSAGKCNLLKRVLFGQDKGDYFDQNGEVYANSGLEYEKTKCFRLIPKQNLEESDELNLSRVLPGNYSVDGERLQIQPIQVKCLPKALRVYCLK